MKVYSDVLTTADLHAATPAGVYIETCEPIKAPRVRARGWRIRLEGSSNRYRNSGQYGAEHARAASYDDHGVWMAQLFEIDPRARIAYYEGRADFHRQTEDAYKAGTSVQS